MSRLRLIKVAQPSTPASNESAVFVDTATRRLTQIDDFGVVNQLTDLSSYNYLRNAGHWFAQRQAPATVTTYSNLTGRSIGADGWGITNENASATYQRTDTLGAPESGLTAQYYGQYIKTTSNGKLFVSQVIESKDVGKLKGRTVRFQCKLKTLIGASATLKMSVIQLTSAGTVDAIPATFISAVGANGVDPTLGTSLAYLVPKSGVTPDNATAQTSNVSCSVNTTWQRFGFVVDIPTTAKNIIIMIHSDSQLTATNGFAISESYLTEGYETQEWCPQSFSEEFLRVKRYYQKTFQYDVAPAQNAGLLGALRFPVTTVGAVANSIIGVWNFPIQLRIAPITTIFYNPSASNAFARNVTMSTDATATSGVNPSDVGIDINATGLLAWAIGNEIKLHCTVDSEL